MQIKILYLYPDLMNLYGSSGNIRCLIRHITSAGQEAEVVRSSVNEPPELDGYDLIYIGAGTERSQKRALVDFMRYREALAAYIENDGICLFCGNSYEMLGKKITDIGGQEYEGLGLYDFESVEEKKRTVADTVCSCSFFNEKIIGFMNKQSHTSIIVNPMFRVLSGAGNAPDRSDEGLCDRGLFATQLSGPILVRNPHFCNFLEKKLYERKGISATCVLFADEQQAYDESLKNLNLRG